MNPDNEYYMPEQLETYRAWIPHSAQEIEDRIKSIKTIVKLMEFAEVIKPIMFMSYRKIHEQLSSKGIFNNEIMNEIAMINS
jgi:hypothetical protein